MADSGQIDDGGPAYPWQYVDHLPALGDVVREQGTGLTQRAYAAIALGVPESGLPWLDAMIERSRRDRIAESVLPYTLSECVLDKAKNPGNPWTARDAAAGWAYQVANVMLTASKVEGRTE